MWPNKQELTLEQALWVQDCMGSGLGLAQGSVLDSAVLKQELTLEQALWVQDYMGSGLGLPQGSVLD